jgi:tRNA(Leu) C34 or U34 (ribose-2'-O)-methylase TrmL
VNPDGIAPAVVLVDPKNAVNVSRALRNCFAYDVGQLWVTGDRWTHGWVSPRGKRRPPREERMRLYEESVLIRAERPLEAFGGGVTPVAVEILKSTQNLAFFEHPAHPVYVFGPEDGSLGDAYRRNCHLHVAIPTRCCLNLADAVATVLYDRRQKRLIRGLDDALPSAAMLREHRGFYDGEEDVTWTEPH